MADRYPAFVPSALAEVLGMPPHQLYRWWMALRDVGVEVPDKYEGEVSAALFFLIPFAIEHPDDWTGAAMDALQKIKAGEPYKPVQLGTIR